MKYDLHIHSCLSPCAENEMTPANIAGFAKLNGIDIIAVTDHNSALNLPAVKRACDEYGLILLPGIEVNTSEEIHILTYFADVETALEMGRRIYERLPEMPYDREIWGSQLVMDENDNVIQQPEKLLTGAADIDLYELVEICGSLGGIVVPAHVDKDSYALLSVLGFSPEDIDFPAFEVYRPEHSLQGLLDTGRLPSGKEILTSSDAHRLEAIAEFPRSLDESSVIHKLIRGR